MKNNVNWVVVLYIVIIGGIVNRLFPNMSNIGYVLYAIISIGGGVFIGFLLEYKNKKHK